MQALTNLGQALLRLVCSRAVVAALMFFTLNFALAFWKPLGAVHPESLPAAHTWAWWATHEFLGYNKPADTVHMNSSGGKKLLDAVVAELANNPGLGAQLIGRRPDAALLATSQDSPW